MKSLLNLIESQDRDVSNLKILTSVQEKEEFMSNGKLHDLVGFFETDL